MKTIYGDNSDNLTNIDNLELIDSKDDSSARVINRPLEELKEGYNKNYNLNNILLKTLYGNVEGTINNIYESFKKSGFRISTINNKKFLRIPTGVILVNRNPEEPENESFIIENCQNIEFAERRFAKLMDFNLNDKYNNIKITKVIDEDGLDKFKMEVSYNTYNGFETEAIKSGTNEIFNSEELFEAFLNQFSQFLVVGSEEEQLKYNCLDTFINIDGLNIGDYYIYYNYSDTPIDNANIDLSGNWFISNNEIENNAIKLFKITISENDEIIDIERYYKLLEYKCNSLYKEGDTIQISEGTELPQLNNQNEWRIIRTDIIGEEI